MSFKEIPGWSNDIEEFYEHLANFLPHEANFIEVGVFLGRSLACLGEQRRDMKLFAVDPWADGKSQGYEGTLEHSKFVEEHGGLFNAFKWAMETHAPEVFKRTTIIQARSEDAEFADGFLANAVFIDGAHDYESVKRDIEKFRTLVKPGGVLSGHDYNSHFPGVMQAVNEAFPNVKVFGKDKEWGQVWYTIIEPDDAPIPVRKTPKGGPVPEHLRRIEPQAAPQANRMTYEEANDWRPGLDGSSTDILPFYKWVAEGLPRAAQIAELGVWRGRSSLFLLEQMIKLDKADCDLYGIDWWDWGHFEAFLQQFTKYATSKEIELFHPIRMMTNQAARMFANESLDLVFIDADHSYVSVREDIENWASKVKPGGILSGHDYTEGLPGVIQAVDEFKAATGADVKIEGTVWWTRRPMKIAGWK